MMVKAAHAKIQGLDFYLLFSIEAMFSAQEKLGMDYIEHMSGEDSEALSTCLCLFSILAENGELARRQLGYDAGHMPGEINKKILTPYDWMIMKEATYCAIAAGFAQEVESSEEVDLYLLENQKKTE